MNTSISLTVYDVVSYLFPGAAFLLSLRYFSGIGSNLPDTQAAIFLLIFGYIVGVLLHLLGHLLYKGFYKEDYADNSLKGSVVTAIEVFIGKLPLLKVKRADNDVRKALSQAVEEKFKLKFSDKRLDLYSFADTFVASLAFQERDLLMAKEGLLRSLTALVIIETIYLCFFVYPQHRLLIVSLALLLIEMLRYGREYHRIIKNQQIYTLTLIKLKQ